MSSGAIDLPELMLRAEQICAVLQDVTSNLDRREERDELKLKIGQARNGIARLQSKFENDQLRITDRTVQAEFRVLVANLMWGVFYGRHEIDRRTYRLLVAIEFGLTGLLTREAGFR